MKCEEVLGRKLHSRLARSGLSPLLTKLAIELICDVRITAWNVAPNAEQVGSWRSNRGGGAAIMSLIQSTRINGHDPYACLKDMLTQAGTAGPRVSEIEQLLPH